MESDWHQTEDKIKTNGVGAPSVGFDYRVSHMSGEKKWEHLERNSTITEELSAFS